MLSLAARWTRHSLLGVARASVVRCKSTQDGGKFIQKPRNEKIALSVVHLVDPQTEKLLPLEPLADILARVKMQTHFVELVGQDPPVVKIIDRKEAAAERKAHKIHLKKSQMEQKELQLSWNSAPADIQHKLKKARAMLEDGDMVNIAFARKAKQKPPPLEDMEERLQEVAKSLEDVAIEKRPMTLERGVGIVYLRAKSSKGGAVASPDV